MQVQHLPIYHFLEGSGKSFVIPVYQRDYAWTRIDCQKLWSDFEDLIDKKRADHFLGTLVTIGNGFQEYIIIDGQQRLTTISILLIAQYNFLKTKANRNEDESILFEQILDFLINRHTSQYEKDKRIRLKPNKQDKGYFDTLFDNPDIKIENSNIISNYNFFLEKFRLEKFNTREIFEAFRKLKIVLIDLIRGQDDPQLIFESLNATGVKLTAGDLIRNYILMALDPIEQEKLHEKYWIIIEKNTGDVAEFIRNYLIYKLKFSIKKDDVYVEFKKFAQTTFENDKEKILIDLVYFSEIYSALIQLNKHPNDAINKQLSRIKKIEFTVSQPYFLDLFNDFNLKILDENIVINVLKLIESYAFRKILVDNTTQGLNKLFITLSKDIKKEPNWENEYLEIINFIILNKSVTQRFPNDDEFENSLVHKEIYKFQSKNRNFLLESLENYESNLIINIDELTIEHIMPQTLTKDWKNKLGESWQEIHKHYLHTLGNLSLTTKNSELSNNSFDQKKAIDFQTSKLKLNYSIDESKNWTDKEITERAILLSNMAKNIWKFPVSSYSKQTPEEPKFDLTSEESFSNSKPTFLFLENDEKGIPLKSWRDLMANVCKYLHDFSPTQFNELINSIEFKWHFDIERPLKSKVMYMPDFFVEGNLSANSIVSFLNKFAEKMNYPADTILFSVKFLKLE